jgi:hypothetical protein
MSGGVLRVVEHLPSKCKALSSSPVLKEKKKAKEKLSQIAIGA